MKTLLQPTMSRTADANTLEGVSDTYGTPAPETEVGAELQARLADTEARLADALNRLAFREAELAALAPDGAAPPRRAVLMAKLAEFEQASAGQESEIQHLRSLAKAREVELGKTKAKLKELERSAKPPEAKPAQAKPKPKPKPPEAKPAQAKPKPKPPEAKPAQAKPKPKPPEAKPQAIGKLKALGAELRQGPPSSLWKSVRNSVLAAGRSLGLTRKGDPERENLRRDIELLTASALFDRNWYLAAYPDVTQAGGIDPAQHYLRFGADEGRDPGPRFSTKRYLERHPDVAEAGMNPLLHYLKFGLEERRAIFASSRKIADATPSAVALPQQPPPEPGQPEPALGAAAVFSLPPVHRKEATWIRHEALCRRQGRRTLELQGTILGWLPSSVQMVGTDSFASLPVIGAGALFCRMMRLDDTKALGYFDADTELELTLPDSRGTPLGRDFLPNVGPIDLADAWFASARDLRLRFARPTPVLRFFQWDGQAGRVILLSEAQIQASNGLADIPTVNPLLPILIAASDAEGVLEGLFLLPFPSLCRGGCHHGELLAREGGGLMERLLALSTSLAEAWLTGDRGAFTFGRIDVDLTSARGSELIFSRAVQRWLDSCFDVRCRPINGAAIADERIRLYLEERLRGEKDEAQERSERESSSSYALQIGPAAIPSLQAIVARGAPPGGSARLATSILVDGASGKPRWLLDLTRLDPGLLDNQWTDGAPSPKVIPLREGARQADPPAALDAAHAFALALTASDDSAALARGELCGPVTRRTESGRAIRPPSGQPEISVLCPYWGDERRFAAFLDSLRLQTNVTNLEVIVTTASRLTESGASLEDLVRRFFPESNVLSCDAGMQPGSRLNLMAERSRSELLLVAAGVLLHDPTTLDLLRHIAEEEKAATIGCALRNVAAAGATGLARLHCAGFYPDGKEEPQGVVATFARIDSPAPLGSWTYPIAANPPPLFMTRKTTWRELGGFNETLPELGSMAVDFAVRATTRGYVHLCTSALSATVTDEAIAIAPRRLSLPPATPPLAWRDAAARSVVVRRLVT